MKRLISIFLLSVLLLCSCSSPEDTKKEPSDMIEINYDKISRRNNRTILMNKYEYLREYFQYFELDTTEEVPNWSIEYATNDETGINVQFLYGEDKQYFYNNIIYKSFDDEDNRCIIPFKSDYNTQVQKILKRQNTLNYVYYKQVEGYKLGNGYGVSYWFTVTSDVLNEFPYWDIHVGDTIKVDYTLNSDYEILNYTYYIVTNPYSESPSFTKIMTCTTEFNVPFKFPNFVYEFDSAKKVTLTIKENYKRPSEIIEQFTIPVNSKIWGDDLLVRSLAFTDDDFKVPWNFEEDVVTDELIIYTIPAEAEK